ncbi:MAG: diaminopimelate decarboxylase [Elusimicrobiota bacterium]
MIDYRRGALCLDGISARILAERFKTPLYVYSKRIVLARLSRLKKEFSNSDTLICYALKANSNRAFCRILARAGCGAEVVSGGELMRALAAGFKPGVTAFSGTGKTREEIAFALKSRIRAFNVESLDEAKTIEREAARLRIKAAIAPRVNPDIAAATHPYIATGRADSKFGMSSQDALRLACGSKSRWIRFAGFHAHLGSQISSLNPYRKLFDVFSTLVESVHADGKTVDFLDIGGGFGIAYQPGDQELDIAALARLAKKTMSGMPSTKLVIEPGRYLSADAGALLTRVIGIKRSSGRKFIVVDAAMNDFARPALSGAKHTIWPDHKPSGRLEKTDVVGPICESADFLAQGVRLPDLESGDVLAVSKTGAYGFSMSSQYNSRPRAAEVLLDGGKARLIRRRETIRDILNAEMRL